MQLLHLQHISNGIKNSCYFCIVRDLYSPLLYVVKTFKVTTILWSMSTFTIQVPYFRLLFCYWFVYGFVPWLLCVG